MLTNNKNVQGPVSEFDERFARIDAKMNNTFARHEMMFSSSAPSAFSSSAPRQAEMTRDAVPVAQTVDNSTDCHVCIPCVLHLYVSKGKMGFDAVCGIIKLECPAPRCCA